MRIVTIPADECKKVLKRVSAGHLACALDNQPYVVPVCFAFDSECIYVFSTMGQKVKWMRQNPKVCLQADEIGNRSNWTSVIVTGRYLELEDPRYTAEKERAKELLAQTAGWWVTPMAERREQVDDLSIRPVFFRIDVESMTGLRGVPEPE